MLSVFFLYECFIQGVVNKFSIPLMLAAHAVRIISLFEQVSSSAFFACFEGAFLTYNGDCVLLLKGSVQISQQVILVIIIMGIFISIYFLIV